MVPALSGVTVSLPEAAFAPDQPPDAVQRVALVLDHSSVTGLPATTVRGEAEKETVTLGWPSLLPPQADAKIGNNVAKAR
jgi:hypothetical protein